MSHYDVIIVGAGPVGLSLALGLAQEKIKILLLEKKDSISDHSKAPAIWPRTLEVLNKLNVARKFIENGIVKNHLRLYDTDEKQELINLSFKEIAPLTQYPFLLILPQSKTEKLLLAEVQRYENIDVSFDSEFDTLENKNDEVIVKYLKQEKRLSVGAKFVAGCDGAHSKVREVLGLKLEGFTFPIKVALADIQTLDEKEIPFPRITNKKNVAIGIKIDKKIWRLILPYGKDSKFDLDERIYQSVNQLFANIISEDYEVIWKSEFKLHHRISNHFVQGRVILGGDAAHLNSPVGGQGMNAGIQDSDYMRHFIIEALEELDTSPFTKYEQLRRKNIRHGVNRFTTSLTKVLLW